jgi:threonine synthase
VIGLRNLYFKNETVNPTWSFKDRYNAVTIAAARELGFRRVVNSSTGNHGASVAAYAAVAGMDCIILCPPEVSETLRLQISTYGAQVVITSWEGRTVLLEYLVRQHRWFPVGLFMPFAISNPYGVEGYKTFAYEIWRQHGGVPAHIFFPSARGNGLYGCWKGWTELKDYGLVDRIPCHHAAQPEGAAPLVQSFRRRLRTSMVVSDPRSVATSTREAVGSDQALDAIYASSGSAVSVTDEEILAEVRALGGEGLCVEPASAAPVAAVTKVAQRGELEPDAPVICILTAAGIKWPADMAMANPRTPVHVEPNHRDLDHHLAGWDWLEGQERNG